MHLTNWTLLALNIIRYASGSIWIGPALGAAALAALTLARVAKKRGISWVHRTDTLLGQVLALCAIFCLNRLALGELDIALLALLEIMIFHALCSAEGDQLLSRIAYAAEWIAAVILLVVGLNAAFAEAEPGALVAMRLLIAGGLVLAQYEAYRRQRYPLDSLGFVLDDERLNAWEHGSPLLLLGALTIVVAYLAVGAELWAAAAASAVFACLYAYRRWREAPPLDAAASAALGSFQILVVRQLADRSGGDWTMLAAVGLPPLLLTVGLIPSSTLANGRTWLSRLLIYMATAQLVIVSDYLLSPFSDFVPGVAFLVYSLLVLELAGWARGRSAAPRSEFLLQAGYGLLAAFLVRHLLVHLQSEAYLAGLLQIRAAIAVLGLGMLVYWLSYAPLLSEGEATRFNSTVAALLWEALLGFGALTIAVEVPTAWQPTVWAACACALYLSARHRRWPVRLQHYSWLFLVAAAAQLAFVASTYATPDPSWAARTEVTSLFAIALQIAYVIFVYRGGGYPEGASLWRLLHTRRHLAVLYPVILGLAIFLFWRFEHALLTLLWVAEVFAVFGLGMYLRERHFVRLALTCLALCIVRLIGFDLAQSNLLLRAGVFVGVGLIMLAINALYRRFRDRIT